MKKLLLLLIVGGVGFVLCAVMGYVNVPGLTPQSPTPQAEKLEPPKEDKRGDVTPPPAPPKDDSKPQAQPEAKKLTPAPEPKKSLYPPILPADVDRAKGLYAKADWSGVGRALDGCERAEIEDGPSTQAARALVRKARLLDTLTKGFKRNPIATAKNLEQISLNNGGTMIGVVTEVGDRLKIWRIGNVEAEVKQDDVGERVKVGRDALRDKIIERLHDKESRIKGDDAFGNMRLGHYCWEYALDVEAVPYLDKAVESDDFPVLAKVFGGSNGQKLVDGWYVFSGKTPPGAKPADRPTPVTAGAPPPPPSPDAPAPKPVAGDSATLAKARAKYDQGVEKYKFSFGDSSAAQASLKAAHEFFKQARDLLGDAEDPASDDLRMQISRLLYDCSKRSAIQ